MTALIALVRTDLLLYFSNRRALAITLAAPILIAAFFGAVLGGGPKKAARIPIAVVSQDTGPIARRIVDAIKADASFEVREIATPEAIEQVRNGKLRAAIVLPPGFGAAAARAMLHPGAKPEVAVHVDPSQPMAVPLVKGLLAQHVMQAVASEPLGGGAGNAGGFQLPFATREYEVTALGRNYNPYAHSFAGMGVQFVLFLGIEMGVGVLYMRRLGLWKRLRSAPLSRSLLLGSRIASGTLISVLLLAVIYAAAIAFFGVRIDGSLAGFAGVVVAFALLTATFGLLIASIGRTPEATRGLAILATLLMVMLGGAWVPTFVFPQWMQAATLVVPTRWAVDGLEAMTWRGLGFDAALEPIAVMLTFSIAFAAVAVASFRWEE